MMIRLFLYLAAFAALALAACQTGVQTADGNDVTGIYYLMEVDGSAVPAMVDHDGQALEVRSGTFFISGDGSCFSRTRFVPPGGTEMTREVNAKYQVEDSRLIMKWENAGTTEGTVEGDVFTMDNHGMIFVYSRKP